MSTAKIYAAVVKEIRARPSLRNCRPMKLLDIGAGTGTLLELLGKEFPGAERYACDLYVDRFPLREIEIKPVDLDRGPLPYADQSFDVVTCTEVVEHVENYRAVVREIHRVLKPGGVAVLSTPNVLNALSRWKILTSGFANLFGPLPVKSDARYSTGHHISPIPYFYLAHALLEANFREVQLAKDKFSRSSLGVMIIFWPLLGLGWLGFWRKETRKYKTITPENKAHVKRNLSARLLFSRSIIVSAQRLPAEA